MSWCRRLCRYMRFWWRTPIEWPRLFSNEMDTCFMVSICMVFLGLISVLVPHRAFSVALRKVFLVICCFIFLCLLCEWLYRKWRIIFPSMTYLHANEFRDPGIAWGRELQETPPDPPLHQPVLFNGIPLDYLNRPRRPVIDPILERSLMREQPPALNPRQVRDQYMLVRIPGTNRFITKRRTRPISRPPPSNIQAQPPERKSDWPSLNLQQPLTRLREMSSEIVHMVKSLSTDTFRNDPSQRSSRGQNVEMHSLAREKGRRDQDESSSHWYSQINYGASTSQSTEYGCPETPQQKLLTESSDECSSLRPESDDSSKSSPEEGESIASDTSSYISGSNSLSESSPEKDQSGASNTSSPEKSGSSESSPHSHEQSKTSKSSSLRQTGSVSSGSSNMVRKSTVIKKLQSDVEVGEPNEPIKTHKSSSSKSLFKEKVPILRGILTEMTEKAPKEKVKKRSPVSETSLTNASIPKRKVSYSEKQHSESESFSSPKKKIPKTSSEKSPKPSTSRKPELHSKTRKVLLTPIKRKKKPSEEEDSSSSQSEKQSSYKPLPPKVPKLTRCRFRK